MLRSENNPVDPKLEPITPKNKQRWEVVSADKAAIVAPKLGAMVSVRLEPNVARLVLSAAKVEGISQSEFLRKAAEERARAIIAKAEMPTVTSNGESAAPLIWRSSDVAYPQKDVASDLIDRIAIAGVGIH